MNIFHQIKIEVEKILNNLAKQEGIMGVISYENIAIEPPRDPSHGDIATNAAMVLCEDFHKNPRELGEMIAERLKQIPYIKKVNVAGAGFVNMTFGNEMWQEIVNDTIEKGKNFEYPILSDGKKVNLEFVSANPTGPMHIGHARAAVFGDIIGRLLEVTGYNVTREFYINDAGNQIKVLVDSTYLRYLEALGEDIGEIPKGLYPGSYLKSIAKELVEKYGDELRFKDEKESFKIISQFTIQKIISNIKSTLEKLGVHHDIFTSEKELHNLEKVSKAIDILKEKGFIYRGVLEPPKGIEIEDWEPVEQTLFRSTAFGDDSDRVVIKADGSYTYFASDLAYTYDKIERGFDKFIMILGADGHKSYKNRLIALAKALAGEDIDFEVILHNMVNLMDNGVPLKMSKRAGTFVTVDDVIADVGKDIIRFIMLNRKNTADIDFDLQKVKEQSNENPVFYVQYAHARGCSVIRNAIEEIPELKDFDKEVDKQILSKLIEDEELRLIKKIAEYPRVIEMAARSYEPHKIAFYLHDLASEFHGLWHSGLKFINKDDIKLTKARLYLAKATILTIQSALSILGVEALESL